MLTSGSDGKIRVWSFTTIKRAKDLYGCFSEDDVQMVDDTRKDAHHDASGEKYR